MQISARVPAMTAMTALTLAAISNDRFILGLGTSGPQVVEGLQGRPFKAPLTRLKETVEIIKLAFAGEKIEYHGLRDDDVVGCDVGVEPIVEMARHLRPVFFNHPQP